MSGETEDHNNRQKDKKIDKTKGKKDNALMLKEFLIEKRLIIFDIARLLFIVITVITFAYLGFYFYSLGLPIYSFYGIEFLGLVFLSFTITLIGIFVLVIVLGSSGLLINRDVYELIYLGEKHNETQCKNYIGIYIVFTIVHLISIIVLYADNKVLMAFIFLVVAPFVAALCTYYFLCRRANTASKQFDKHTFSLLFASYILFVFSIIILEALIGSFLVLLVIKLLGKYSDLVIILLASIIASVINYITAKSFTLYVLLFLVVIVPMMLFFSPMPWYPLHTIKLGLFNADLYLTDEQICCELQKYYDCKCENVNIKGMMSCKNVVILLSSPTSYYVGTINNASECGKHSNNQSQDTENENNSQNENNKPCNNVKNVKSDRTYIEISKKYVKYTVHKNTLMILDFYKCYSPIFQTPRRYTELNNSSTSPE